MADEESIWSADKQVAGMRLILDSSNKSMSSRKDL